MDFGLFLDVFVGIVLLISVLISFLRGFIREVLTIFGIVGGMLAAYMGGPLLSPLIRGWLGVKEGADDVEKFLGILPYPLLADILAYGLILITVVIILSILSHYIAEFVKNLGLGALDRTLGVVFGVARAVFVLGLLYLLPYYMIDKEQKSELLGNSKSVVYLEATARWMDGFIPKDVVEQAQEGLNKVNENSDIRKKFEEMDILTPLQESSDDAKKQEKDKVKDGYTDDFRNKMDELIENNVKPTGTHNE